jgi:hypothetical protein
MASGRSGQFGISFHRGEERLLFVHSCKGAVCFVSELSSSSPKKRAWVSSASFRAIPDDWVVVRDGGLCITVQELAAGLGVMGASESSVLQAGESQNAADRAPPLDPPALGGKGGGGKSDSWAIESASADIPEVENITTPTVTATADADFRIHLSASHDDVPPELHVELPPAPPQGALVKGARRERAQLLRWGYVTAREYRRQVGGEGVPLSGGWPLGLDSVVVTRLADEPSSPVDEGEITRRASSKRAVAASPRPPTLETPIFGSDGLLSPYLKASDDIGDVPSLDLDAAPVHDGASDKVWQATESYSPSVGSPMARRGRCSSFDGSSGLRLPLHPPSGKDDDTDPLVEAVGGDDEGFMPGESDDLPSPVHRKSPAKKKKNRRKKPATGVSLPPAKDPLRDPVLPPENLKPGEYIVGTVDEFDSKRYEELLARESSLPPHLRRISTRESRQFSHRANMSNPLFGRLDESERRRVIQRNLDVERGDSKVLFDSHTAASLELAEMRRGRSDVGCRCEPVTANMKKMSAKKMRQVLDSRGIHTKDLDRSSLAKLLLDLAASEALCSMIDGLSACPCAAEGVECHFEVCKCECLTCQNPHGRHEYRRKEVMSHIRTTIRDTKATEMLEPSVIDLEGDTATQTASNDDAESAAAPAAVPKPPPQESAKGSKKKNQRRKRSRSVCG